MLQEMIGRPAQAPRIVNSGLPEIELSVVIPVYNEEASLEELYRRLKSVLDALGRNYEVILVNDGSRDRTAEILAKICQRDARFRALHFARNFGHQAAVTAGIDYASGKAIMIMDADLQDPPEIIPEFLKKWEEGYEVVYAIRQGRKENFLLRAAFKVFYRLLRKVASVWIFP
ncbi:MAG: glycosyltransferase family 2 protein [Chloroherpetonaceae bacterium]|nr:glycosyltransferase family 2 protein [Chloroherpetonaceae bacterium]